MKKILIPIDFSDVSRHAIDFAVEIAEELNAEIYLLHSISFNYFNDFVYPVGVNLQVMVDEVNTSVLNRMKEVVDKLDTKVKIEVRTSSLHLFEAVKDIVKEEQVDMIMLGTQGSSGWSELLVGSNTEKIVRWAECPVIAVPGKTELKNINKILVPIDLTEIHRSFLEELILLQRLFTAELEFLWIRTPHNVENSKLVTEEFSDILKARGFEHTSFVVANNVFPSEGILEQAKALNADMIAMATHARRGISHWFSGSVTEDTVNHVHVPVWTYKLGKEEKPLELSSFRDASGTPEYKRIQID